LMMLGGLLAMGTRRAKLSSPTAYTSQDSIA
jgi:hypothetical protein